MKRESLFYVSILSLSLILVGFLIIQLRVEAPASTFIIAKNFTLGNSSLTVNIKILNSTLSLYSWNFSNNRPLLNLSSYSNTNRAFNQTVNGGNGEWIIITLVEPSVTGPATSTYFSGNKTLKLTATSNGAVKLTWP